MQGAANQRKKDSDGQAEDDAAIAEKVQAQLLAHMEEEQDDKAEGA